ncbi:MAG TPA: lysine--tRNA ligase [Blastocatellia bacterium]|nr:lysine--tRNA ligase [Blastocatellia bacterium]
MSEPVQLEEYLREVQRFTIAVYEYIENTTPRNYYKLIESLKSHQVATANASAFALQVIETREPNVAEEHRSRLRNYINLHSGPLPSIKDVVANSDLHALNRLQEEKSDILRESPDLQRYVVELSNTLAEWYQHYRRLYDFVLNYGLGESFARQESLQAIADLGIDTYPHRFDRTHSISDIVETYGLKNSDELRQESVRVSVAGRIHAINIMGKAGFIRITDGRALLQIYVRSNDVDEQCWRLFKLLHIGDFIGTTGLLFRTKTDELSIHAESLTFLSKALVPPPDKYYGLHEIELRHRQRYADLIANREVRHVFETRSRVIRLIRKFFDERGYIEVETPMLTPLPTGAAARPFKTHHNALDIDLYARIAPELYLKRLIVGGFEKVYEINRNFRNEGIDRSHNPEFTMLEWYEAYSEYEDLVRLTEELISSVVDEVCGKTLVEYGEDRIDFARPWKRFTMREAVIHYWPNEGERPTLQDVSSLEGILAWAEKLPSLREEILRLRNLDYGYVLGEVFENVAEAELTSPTFITEFPTELSPLSKQNQADPRFVDRFELFIAGMEIANGFCEINDPADQRQRFEAQMKLRERGDEEAMLIDEDYIRALSCGMPPAAGEGVGIDRLVMLLTNQRSIRDVILFPHMRPEKGTEDKG